MTIINFIVHVDLLLAMIGIGIIRIFITIIIIVI